MKKFFAIGLLACVVMLSGCVDHDKDDKSSSKNDDKPGAVEIDISDFGSYSGSGGDDIVFDFKNPEDKDKVVVTPKQ